MKLITNSIQKGIHKLGVYSLLILSTFSLGSCIHDDDDYVQPDQAAFAIINASPTKTPIDFYIDNQKVLTREGIAYGAFTGYYTAYTGTRTGVATAYNSQTKLHTEKLVLENNRFYTIFAVNSADTLTFVNIKEQDVLPESGKAKIRFINLSPDAPAYSLQYEGDTATFANRAYKEYTPFKNVPAKTSANFNLINTATSAVVATISGIEIKSGGTYSIWAAGLGTPANDTQKLGIKVTFQGNFGR